MKKVLRILLIIALALTVLGGGVFLVGFAATGWDIHALGDTQIEMRRYDEVTENPLTALTIDFENADISVAFDETVENVSVDYPQLQNKKGENRSVVSVIEGEGALTITEDINKWSFGSWDFTSPKVSVVLPAERTYTLILRTNNGTITFFGEGRADGVTATTDNGNIKVIDGLTCKNAIVFDSDNGNITVDKFTANALSAETDNGNILLREGTAAQSLTLKTNNGDVSVGGAVAAERIELETDNGDIYTHDGVLDGKMLTAISDNGDVTLRLAGKQTDYVVLVKTDNGKSNLSPTPTVSPDARNLKIATDNGDIYVTFAEE